MCKARGVPLAFLFGVQRIILKKKMNFFFI